VFVLSLSKIHKNKRIVGYRVSPSIVPMSRLQRQWKDFIKRDIRILHYILCCEILFSFSPSQYNTEINNEWTCNSIYLGQYLTVRRASQFSCSVLCFTNCCSRTTPVFRKRNFNHHMVTPTLSELCSVLRFKIMIWNISNVVNIKRSNEIGNKIGLCLTVVQT
jgi:hypothetical protein